MQEILDKWHIKREITIGHIVTTLSVAIGVLWWSSNVSNQLVLLHREDQILHERISESRDEQRRALQDIKGALLRIEEKLDKKVDR